MINRAMYDQTIEMSIKLLAHEAFSRKELTAEVFPANQMISSEHFTVSFSPSFGYLM